MLSAPGRRRLIGALELLRSPAEGERDAAALAALRILDAARLDWASVIPEPEPDPPHDGDNWRKLAEALLRSHAAAFNPSELDFLRNVTVLPRISQRQFHWLLRLAERVRRATRGRRGAKAA